jgi:ParB-like nuclease domain
VRTKGLIVDDASQNRDESKSSAKDWLKSDTPIVEVPVASLLRGDSPRLHGESKSQLESMINAAHMPPIIVFQPTMQVIDGMHRLTAARRRHQETIAVRFFNGTVDEAFVLAVEANIKHGLPLTPKDRKAAAARILRMFPDWSDRRIAATAGLSHHTVGDLRRDLSTGQIAQINRRLGRDGRTRSIPAREPRESAPASSGPVADQSPPESVSAEQDCVDNVHHVQPRLEQRIEPLAPSAGRGAVTNSRTARGLTAVNRLSNNPAVWQTLDGKALVKLLSQNLRQANEAQSLIRNAPEHSLDTIADAAAAIGESWSHLAQELRTKAKCG